MRPLKYGLAAFCATGLLLAFLAPAILFGNAPKWLEREVMFRSLVVWAIATACGVWIGWNRRGQ